MSHKCLFIFYLPRDLKEKLEVLGNGLASSELNMAAKSITCSLLINLRNPTQPTWLVEIVFLQSLFPEVKGKIIFKVGNDLNEAIQGKEKF